MGRWRNLGMTAPTRVATLAASLFATGCLIPTYHQPQGFSSTYYRHLQQVAATPHASSRTVPPSALPKLSDTEEATQAVAEEGSWWSWLRRPLTFRSAATDDSETQSKSDGASARR
jgi:hypothetical protein